MDLLVAAATGAQLGRAEVRMVVDGAFDGWWCGSVEMAESLTQRARSKPRTRAERLDQANLHAGEHATRGVVIHHCFQVEFAR